MSTQAEVRFGQPTPRVDGVAKVTGAAHYASDEPVANPAYAVLVTSAIARGRVQSMALGRAKAVGGVLDILTHETVGDAVKPPSGPDGGLTTSTLESDRVWHDGQIVAVVVADTLEAATEAASLVEVGYAAQTPSATFGSPGVEVAEHKSRSGPDPKKGDAAAALAAAAFRVEADYDTPTQHHNPLELFTTTCVWNGGQLTVFEPSQFMWGLKGAVAAQLGIDPANVRTVSRFVGGAFGSKGGATARTAWVALAAKRLGRPVKLVPTREQGFTIATYRAETQQSVKLGADADGRLTAFVHEGREVTSRPSGYGVAGVEVTARMYACPNIATAVEVVHADRNTPGFMRAPAEVPYMFGLESAMDELAHAMGKDPIELRRINDTPTDPVSGLDFSARSLMRCFDAASAAFGWDRRRKEPGAVRDGDWLVGFGCATACYPTNIAPAAARLSLSPEGRAIASLAAHEIGTGATTAIAMTVAQGLGIAVADVTVRLGDSELPPVSVAGGSNNAASTTLAVAKACDEVRRRVAEAAVAAADSRFHGTDPAALRLSAGALVGPDGRGEALSAAVGRTAAFLEVYAEHVPAGLPATAMAGLYRGKVTMSRGDGRADVSAFSFGAHLVEVRVHAMTREIRVPRVVSAFAAGTIVNPTAARSQFMGGAIWGLSAALHEATEIDATTARYTNKNLADYMVPVSADVPSVEIIIVPEVDERVNRLGVKGIGEIGIVGMNAAVANAVFNATGKRLRSLPLRAEMLL